MSRSRSRSPVRHGGGGERDRSRSPGLDLSVEAAAQLAVRTAERTFEISLETLVALQYPRIQQAVKDIIGPYLNVASADGKTPLVNLILEYNPKRPRIISESAACNEFITAKKARVTAAASTVYDCRVIFPVYSMEAQDIKAEPRRFTLKRVMHMAFAGNLNALVPPFTIVFRDGGEELVTNAEDRKEALELIPQILSKEISCARYAAKTRRINKEIRNIAVETRHIKKENRNLDKQIDHLKEARRLEKCRRRLKKSK